MNSRRHTIASLSIVLLAVTIMSVSVLGQSAYAGGGGISLSAECSDSTCSISGTSDRSDLDVTITASNDLAIVSVAQASVSGGSYVSSFNVSNWDDGSYTIEANQGTSSKYSISVNVDVSGGSSMSSVSDTTQTDAVVVEETAAETEDAELSGLQLNAGGVEGSTTIDVSGTTDRNGDITLTVRAPNGNVVAVSQITPSGDSFSTTIEVGGPLWSQDGMYEITAHQGAASSHQKTVSVEIIDGHVIPEFGVIAVMILAVAIVSIIVVTAKTRLNIVPRY